MLPRAYPVVGVAAAAVLTALVAASLSTEPILGPQHISPITAPAPTKTAPIPVVQAADDAGIPTWFTVSMTILLALYALALLILAVLHKRGHDEEEAWPESSGEEEPATDSWLVVLPVDLGNAAQAQLAVLHLGTPRNAIVACWLALRTATARAGMPEIASETSEEFMVRAMESLGLDPPAIRVLASLYREARFSEHVMHEGQRDRAGQALRVLADQLTRRDDEPAPDGVLEGLVR